jgi:hypothetical protein
MTNNNGLSAMFVLILIRNPKSAIRNLEAGNAGGVQNG